MPSLPRIAAAAGVLLLALVLAVPAVAQDDAASARAEYANRAKALKLDRDRTADDHVTLGRWCLARELTRQAAEQFLLALKRDTDSADAQAELTKLGYSVWEGKWSTNERIFRSRWNALRAIERKVRAIGRKIDRNRELKERGRRLRTIKPAEQKLFDDWDAAARFAALGTWAAKHELATEAGKAFVAALKADVANETAHLGLGHREFEGTWYKTEAAYDRAVGRNKLCRAYVAASNDAERARLFRRLVDEYGYRQDRAFLDAARHRAETPRGLRLDHRLKRDAEKYPGGRYSIHTPPKLDVFQSYPLIVFLHGGGPNVGDNKDYRYMWGRGPVARGWLVAAPTVLQKKTLAWNNPTHVGFVRAIVAEMKADYPVDPARVYLAGHSMGGYGTFYIGPQTVDLFAAIVPMSGSPGRTSLKTLVKTPTFIIHGADDTRVPPGGSRRAAKALKSWGYPVRYDEINGYGHGIPHEKWLEALDWLADKKLQTGTKAKPAAPRGRQGVPPVLPRRR